MKTKIIEIPSGGTTTLRSCEVCDMRGREGYDGDVAVIQDGATSPVTVVINFHNSEWYLGRLANGYYDIFIIGLLKECVIIGNVYEEPALMPLVD